jgi:hypothetical protein
MDWRCGSSRRGPALQAQALSSNPNPTKKKKNPQKRSVSHLPFVFPKTFPINSHTFAATPPSLSPARRNYSAGEALLFPSFCTCGPATRNAPPLQSHFGEIWLNVCSCRFPWLSEGPPMRSHARTPFPTSALAHGL